MLACNTKELIVTELEKSRELAQKLPATPKVLVVLNSRVQMHTKSSYRSL